MSEHSARSLRAEKAELRGTIGDRLAAMDPAQRREAEGLLQAHLWEWLAAGSDTGSPEPGPILAFISLRSEPEIRPLLERLLRAGRRVVVPAIDPDRPRGLRLVEIPGGADLASLRSGPLGTREPESGRVIPWSEIGVALVPGVAFTHRGARLGRGGGYFDALLADPAGRARTVGVAFECQVVDRIPLEPHDRPVDRLCTERGIRSTA